MRRLVEAVAAAAVVALLAGCGGSDYSSPTATYHTMWEAAKAGNRDAVTACHSEDARKKMAEKEKLLAEMLDQAKKAKVEIGAEKIDGNKATLEVTLDGATTTCHFVKEGDAWKISLPQAPSIDPGKMKDAVKMMEGMPKGMMEGLKKGLENMKK